MGKIGVLAVAALIFLSGCDFEGRLRAGKCSLLNFEIESGGYEGGFAENFSFGWESEGGGGRWVLSVRQSDPLPVYLLVKNVSPAIEGIEEGGIIQAGVTPTKYKSALLDESKGIRVETYSSFALLDDEVVPWVKEDRISVFFPVASGGHVMQADGVYDTKYMKNSSHEKEAGLFHAVDIVADMGDLVVAAKNGIVVSVQDGFPDYGCNDSRLALYDNRVIVLQDDGLEATYGHLMNGSVSVIVGDRVFAGDALGAVGNSGASFIPHLHFQVGGLNRNGYMTFPLSFSCGGVEHVPVVGESLCKG